ncbi:MAG: hypothetical protein IJT34_02470 [Butyrivibrio sp.]|nr:hypothetical protein [Butyrivibrio sp.]
MRRKITQSSAPERRDDPSAMDLGEFRRWLLLTLGLCLCNLPVLLGVYPGFFVYDAYEEWLQTATQTYNTHHPLLHVWLLGHVIELVHGWTDSYNAGICTWIVLQMLVINGCFAYGVEFLRRHGAGRVFRGMVFLFFGFFPTIVMYTLCSCKDGLFSALLLLTVLFLYEEKRWPMVVSATFLLLLRHNGLYAWIVYILLVGIGICLTKCRKGDNAPARLETGVISANKGKFLLWLLLPVLCAVLINTGMTRLLHATGGEHQEILTVPIQQLGRTYNAYPQELSAAERETLFRYLPEEAFPHYTEKLSDPLKYFFINPAYEADRWSFWQLWVQLGLRHPGSYLQAWLGTSRGFWDPWTIVDLYEGHAVFTIVYGGSSYFGYETEEPGTRHSFLPFVDRVYRSLSLNPIWQKLPVIHLLLAPGFVFWFDLGCLVLLIMWCRRRPHAGGGSPDGSQQQLQHILLCALPVFLIWLTVLLGPGCLVRYVVYLWYLAPFAVYAVYRINKSSSLLQIDQ